MADPQRQDELFHGVLKAIVRRYPDGRQESAVQPTLVRDDRFACQPGQRSRHAVRPGRRFRAGGSASSFAGATRTSSRSSTTTKARTMPVTSHPGRLLRRESGRARPERESAGARPRRTVRPDYGCPERPKARAAANVAVNKHWPEIGSAPQTGGRAYKMAQRPLYNLIIHIDSCLV